MNLLKLPLQKNSPLGVVSILLALLVSSAITTPAMATLNVQVLNTTIPVGGTGFLDVVITGANDPVQASQLELRITPQGPVNSNLQFSNPQTVGFLTNGTYLFFNDSFNDLLAFDPRTVSQTIVQHDTFSTNDSTLSFANVMVTAQRLLARVDLAHIIPFGTDPNTVVGDQFLVSVDAGNTQFLDDALNNIEFNSSPGVVTLSSAAVPEPGTWTLLGAGLTVWSLKRKRQARKRVPTVSA